MKRWIILLLLTLCGALLVTATALLQENKRPQLGGREINEQQIVAPDALPQSYLNQNRLHKLIIDNKDDAAVYSQLAQAGALRNEIDYGSFKLVVVDEETLGGRAALQALPVAPRDDQNLIALNGYVIDTSNPQPLSKELPAGLKQSRMADALDRKAGPVGGLFIVQFVGPIQDAWLEALGEIGVDVITYVPSNAYVVRADAVEAIGLISMKEQHPFVQWLGDYEPAYKLRPGLRAKLASGATETVKVTVQALDGAEGDQVIDNLRASAIGSFDQRRVLKYRNVTVTIPVWRLAELANSDGVFAIEEWGEMRPMDEAQGQIVAGNLSGGAPTGPGYLSWLASKGFNSSQFTSFSVNVVDDTPTLTGHPDLPTGRVVFQNNPSNCTGPQNGHGFIDAHIVAGFNNNTGSAFEDALGFNYGLGIAPWARVGATGFLCGDFALDPTAWENTAYSQGARISTNSWGSNVSGVYDVNAQEFDFIVRDARSGVAGNQQMITVFSAGNDGPAPSSGKSPGTAKQDFALVIFNSSCDPFADAVAAATLVANPQNAVGAPDGQTANIVSLLGIGSLTLDMGLGEEGTGNLNVHYGGLSAELITSVEFLAAERRLSD